MTGTVDVTGFNPISGNQELIHTDGANALLVSGTGTGGSVEAEIDGPLGRRSDATSVSVALSTENVATLNGMAVAQGSTTATQVGSLVQGAVTTASPVYTTAQTSPLSLDLAGQLRTAEYSTISTANSSTTPLANGGVFTGTAISTLGFGCIVVSVTTSHASATDGLSIQQSQDGTNWDVLDVYTLAVATGANFCIPVKAAFARVVYTNGGTLQTTFRLQMVLKPQMPVASAFRPADGASIQNDFPGGLSIQQLYNGTTIDLTRSIINSTNSTGTGISAVGLVAQLDDTSPNTVSENQFGNLRMAPNRALMTMPYSSTAEVWSYAAAASGIANTTTAVTIKASAGAGLRNYITSIDLSTTLTLTTATEFAIRDGAGGTVLWRCFLGTTGPQPRLVSFGSPLRGSVATLLEVVTITATGVTGATYFNATGFIAP